MNADDLDQLPTAELQQRAFALARHRHDWGFFIDLFRHTPAAAQADNLDPDVAEIGVAIDDLVAMWRQMTEGEWGEAEPLARARFVDYLREGEDTVD
ncbi:hypothetical protein [Glycomyces arizonensis]|uniref:hypothetical protein n=1 Tax=Glycomyces arizonensis TaxID=256035 RepID=UPI00041EF511|nr:hypothetical protein [Glycomyces arizonensis]